MLNQVIRQLPELDLINRSARRIRQFFETTPHQHGAGDVIALDSRAATLATLQAGHLFDFAVQLLNLPPNGTHLLGVSRRSLSHIVCHDIIRAVCGDHEPEQLQTMAFREVFDVDILTARFLFFAPFERIYSPVIDRCRVAFIYLAVILYGAVVNLAISLDMQHELTTRVTRVSISTQRNSSCLSATTSSNISVA